MECDGFLIKLLNGDEICIPFLIEIDLDHRPDPGPLRRVFEDLATLVIINQRVAGIANKEVRGRITESIQQAARTIAQQLPEGVTLGDRLLSDRSMKLDRR